MLLSSCCPIVYGGWCSAGLVFWLDVGCHPPLCPAPLPCFLLGHSSLWVCCAPFLPGRSRPTDGHDFPLPVRCPAASVFLIIQPPLGLFAHFSFPLPRPLRLLASGSVIPLWSLRRALSTSVAWVFSPTWPGPLLGPRLVGSGSCVCVCPRVVGFTSISLSLPWRFALRRHFPCDVCQLRRLEICPFAPFAHLAPGGVCICGALRAYSLRACSSPPGSSYLEWEAMWPFLAVAAPQFSSRFPLYVPLTGFCLLPRLPHSCNVPLLFCRGRIDPGPLLLSATRSYLSSLSR